MTQSVVFDWKTQKERGDEGEAALDKYFEKWYTITSATLEEERQGIDRHFIAGDGRKLRVQYKTDYVARKTKRIFVETMSRVQQGVYGWAWTCRADILVYWIYPHYVLIVEPNEIRKKLPDWIKTFPKKRVHNRNRSDWVTEGYVVPLGTFQGVCRSVRTMAVSG